MREHPTLQQFSEHHCEHWETRGSADYCVMFGLYLDNPALGCDNHCFEFEPWDCTIEELLTEEIEEVNENV